MRLITRGGTLNPLERNKFAKNVTENFLFLFFNSSANYFIKATNNEELFSLKNK